MVFSWIWFGFNQFFYCPSVVCESCCACWRQAVGTVNAAEIEICDCQRDGVDQVFHLARETECQTGKSFVEVAQRAVQPFGVRCRDIGTVRIAALDAGFNPDALPKAVTMDAVFIVPLIAVKLLNLCGVMRFVRAMVKNTANKASPAIGRDLILPVDTGANIYHKGVGSVFVALADSPR